MLSLELGLGHIKVTCGDHGISMSLTRNFGLVISILKKWHDGVGSPWQRPTAYHLPWFPKWWWMIGELLPICERCWCEFSVTVRGVKWEPSYTMYAWNGKGRDPNRALRLCRRCEVQHREYWKDMWSNVPGHGG